MMDTIPVEYPKKELFERISDLRIRLSLRRAILYQLWLSSIELGLCRSLRTGFLGWLQRLVADVGHKFGDTHYTYQKQAELQKRANYNEDMRR